MRITSINVSVRNPSFKRITNPRTPLGGFVVEFIHSRFYNLQDFSILYLHNYKQLRDTKLHIKFKYREIYVNNKISYKYFT